MKIFYYIFYIPEKIGSFVLRFILKRKIFVISLVVLTILIPTALKFFNKPKNIEAGWWNDDWRYRKTFTITNNIASDLTNFQVKINDYDTQTDIGAGKILSTCADIRFTSNEGVELPYWIETGCNTSTTDIWVKIDLIPASLTKTIYMYYGSPSVSAQSNGDNVFELFDDFETGTLDKWTVGNTSYGSWTIDGSVKKEGNYSVHGSDTSSSGYPTLYKDYVINGSFVMEQNVYMGETGAYHYPFFWKSQIGSSLYWGVASSNNYWQYHVGGGYTNYATAKTYSATTWYKQIVKFDGSTNHYVSIDSSNFNAVNAKDSAGNTITGISQIMMIPGAGTATGGDLYIDNFFLRQYASTEPSVGAAGSEEKGGAPVAYWRFDEGYGTTAYDESDNSNDLTIVSAPPWTNGAWPNKNQKYLGKALDYDGSADYSYVADTASLSITGDLTISAWIKPEAVAGETLYAISGKWDTSDEEPAPQSYLLAQYEDEIRMYIDSSSDYLTTNDADLLVGNWYHIVAIYSSSAQTVTIYVNGQEELGEVTGTIPGSIKDDADRYHVAASGSTSAVTDLYNGVIDEVKVFDYALTFNQVNVQYNRGYATVLGAGKNNSDLGLTNLTAWWKLDEHTGTSSVYDSSGNGYTGTMLTMEEADWIPGKFGSALYFDGTEGISTAYTSFPTTAFTLSAWIKYTTGGVIIGRLNSAWTSAANGSFMFSANAGSFGLYGRWSNASVDHQVATTGHTDGNWHHIATTWDGALIKDYLDGVQLDTQNEAGSFSGSTLAIYLAQRQYSASPARFTGGIDNIKIWDIALSADQVLYQYNLGKPVAYWRFDEGYGTTAYDESDNSNDLTIVSAPAWVNGAWPNKNQKYLGKALDYDGSADYSYVADTASLSITGDLTISAWIKPEAVAGETLYDIAGKWDSNGLVFFYSYLLAQYGDEIRMYISSNSNYKTTSAVNLLVGNWYHIVGVYNATAQTVTIYVNGKEEAGTVTGTIPSSLSDSSNRFHVGAEYSSSTAQNFYNGTIDEVKVYNYALTTDEVKVDYNQDSAVVLGAGKSTIESPTSNIKGWWKLDEGRSTTANDTSGNNNTGTLTNMEETDWISGKWGKALDFGTTEYVSLANESSFDFGSGSFSVTGWFRHSASLTDDDVIFGKSCYGASCASEARGYRIYMNTSDQICFGIDDDSTWNPDDYACGGSYNNDTWYFFTAVKNSTSSIITYINAVPIASDTDITGSSIDNSNAAYIGNIVTSGIFFTDMSWVGQIDNVKVFDKALSQAEINWEYNQAKPIAHWRLDEKTGITAYDDMINNNDITLANSPSQVAGKFNNGLDFESGSSQYGYAADSASLSITGDLTLSAWIKPESNATGRYIAGKWDNDGNVPPVDYHSYLLEQYNDEIRMYIGASSNYKTTDAANLVAGNWYHVVGVYNAAAQTVTIYVNSKEEAGTVTGTIPSSISDDVGKLCVAVEGCGGGKSGYYDGIIDELKLYNYAMSADQVKVDYNNSAAIRF